LAAAGVTGWPAVAEEAAPGPTFVQVLTVHTHPGKQAVYAAFRAEFARTAADMGWPVAIYGSSSLVADGAQYRFVSFHDNLRNLLEPGPVSVMFADEPGGLGRVLSESVAQVRTEVFLLRPDLGGPTPVPEAATIEVWYVFRDHIRSGQEASYETYLARAVEAARQRAPGASWVVYAPGINTGPVYHVAVPMTGDLGTGPPSADGWIREVFGARNGEQIIRRGQDALESRQVTLMRNRPDLSYYPPPAE